MTLRMFDCGDSGLNIEVGSHVSEEVNAQAIALSQALEVRKLAGIREIIPTYRSVLVQFDPLLLARTDLAAQVRAAWDSIETAAQASTLWQVPICYGGECGVDLAEFALARGLSKEEVVRRHSAVTYRVYMIGFAPGFTYLGGLDPSLHASRRGTPRLKTPVRSVAIGGQQSAISPPMELPSGWHLIGQTPFRTYDAGRGGSEAFLLSPGDHVRFEPVSHADYLSLCKAAEAGAPVARKAARHDM